MNIHCCSGSAGALERRPIASHHNAIGKNQADGDEAALGSIQHMGMNISCCVKKKEKKKTCKHMSFCTGRGSCQLALEVCSYSCIFGQPAG